MINYKMDPLLQNYFILRTLRGAHNWTMNTRYLLNTIELLTLWLFAFSDDGSARDEETQKEREADHWRRAGQDVHRTGPRNRRRIHLHSDATQSPQHSDWLDHIAYCALKYNLEQLGFDYQEKILLGTTLNVYCGSLERHTESVLEQK